MFSRHRGHTFVAPPTDNAITVFISSNTFDFDLLTRLGGALTEATTVTIRIDTGVIVQALSPGTPAMDLSGVMFAGSVLRIINHGYIIGHGGRGGRGSAAHVNASGNHGWGTGAVAGMPGGDAIRGPGAGITFELTNGAGRILGGGGGGGGGGATITSNGGAAAAGGGGGGAGGGIGGDGGSATVASLRADNGTPGSTGVDGTFGLGSAAVTSGGANAGAGGNGGNWGAAGSAGGNASGETGGAGGAGGKAIDLNGGSATFLNGSGAPNVQGAIS